MMNSSANSSPCPTSASVKAASSPSPMATTTSTVTCTATSVPNDADHDFKRLLFTLPDLPVCRDCGKPYRLPKKRAAVGYCDDCYVPTPIECDFPISITTTPIHSRVTRVNKNARVYILKNRTQ